MLITEKKLRRIIRSVLLEGGIPKPEDYEKDLQIKLSEWNTHWQEVEPAHTSTEFEDDDPLDFNSVKAAKILNCKPEDLLVYYPISEVTDEYDENHTMEYVKRYLKELSGTIDKNINGYVIIKDELYDENYLYTRGDVEKVFKGYIEKEDPFEKITSKLRFQSADEKAQVEKFIDFARQEYQSDIDSGMSIEDAIEKLKDYLSLLYDFDQDRML